MKACFKKKETGCLRAARDGHRLAWQEGSAALRRAWRGARPVHVQLKDSQAAGPPTRLSPCRHSDGRPGSCLLGAVAQLRRQLRARLLRAPPAPRRSPSAWRWVGGALLGPVVLSKCPRLCLVALCEAEEVPPAHPRPYVTESHFNWKLFWQFLRPHLLVLGAAILVRSSPAPIKPGMGKTQPELRRDSLPASWSFRGDFRKQQGLA